MSATQAAHPATRRSAGTSAATGRGARLPAARPAGVRPGHLAAAQVLEKHTMAVTLPAGIGTVRVPTPDRLAFYGGIAALAAFGILEWPVALAIGAGHLLADDHHHKILAEFGEALGEA
jgi:hypothetical protein